VGELFARSHSRAFPPYQRSFRRRLDKLVCAELGFRVVVVVRHPLAVISSLKRFDLTFDFKNLLEQPLLMNERLSHFRPEVRAAARVAGDVVDQGCLLWRIIYDGVLADQADDSSVCVVRHEDLSMNPIQQYARLYELLELHFGEKAALIIDEQSRDRNPKEGAIRAPFRGQARYSLELRQLAAQAQ
jgi:hypothetical protein